jgi:hypothetical protein
VFANKQDIPGALSSKEIREVDKTRRNFNKNLSNFFIILDFRIRSDSDTSLGYPGYIIMNINDVLKVLIKF